MITATIQGISKKDNGKHISAFNGEIITGKEAQKRIQELFDDCDEVNLSSQELFCKLSNGKFFCAMAHPQKDEIGRTRIALLVWDKDTASEIIKQTIEVMGLEYERFKRLKAEYLDSKESKDSSNPFNKNALLIAGGIAVAAVAFYLLIKK